MTDAPVFVEVNREELPCSCGCKRRWLVSRGEVQLDGARAAFIAIPTVHGPERAWWMAIGLDGGAPWVCTRTARAQADLVANVVDGDRTPACEVAPLAGGAAVRPRAEVVADRALVGRVFAVHDAVLRQHPDARPLFDPQHGRDYTFKVPDCVVRQPPGERSPRNQENFAECGDAKFVRALLPVPVSDGSELRIGVWVRVPDEAFFALLRVFWDDEAAYARMHLRGTIDNALTLAGNPAIGTTVALAARDPSQCLFVVEATAPWLAALMREGVSIVDLPRFLADLRASLGAATA